MLATQSLEVIEALHRVLQQDPEAAAGFRMALLKRDEISGELRSLNLSFDELDALRRSEIDPRSLIQSRRIEVWQPSPEAIEELMQWARAHLS